MIFVFGIFGAGKSTICKEVSKIKKVQYIKASDLIYQFKNIPGDKRTDNLETNQDIVLSQLKTISLTDNDILEGHLCLLNKNNEIFHVPVSYLEKMNINKLVEFIVLPDIAKKRLYLRDGIEYQISDLAELQSQEIKYAQYISSRLNIPLSICSEDDSLKKIIANIYNMC